MAAPRRTVQVTVDRDLVDAARAELASVSHEDAEVVEKALNAYLLGQLLSRSQQRADLTEEEAERLAVEELHAMRQARENAE